MHEDNQYPTIYKDENYAIWIDIADQFVNILHGKRIDTAHDLRRLPGL